VLIAGATAVGKSAVAMELARRVGGEIISVDSMQVYRGMDIGTAKPSPAERAEVPHHLIDVVELSESFDAAKFVQLAKTAMAQIQSRGRTPIFCGGTGLYFKAFLEGLGAAPAADDTLRAELRRTPLADLLEELEQLDPEAYRMVDRANPRRVIRALEVIRVSGRPYSEQRAAWQKASQAEPPPPDRWPYLFVGLERDHNELRGRIDERVKTMFEQGLVEEVKSLLSRGLAENLTAMQALGYRQVVEYLGGARSLEETVPLVQQKTRHYAKRQKTWFRRQAHIHWITLSGPNAAEFAVGQILAQRS
jgi:tRNA dimethylallyltransferase